MYIPESKLRKIYERNSVSEICRFLGISRPTLYKALKKNGISTKRIGDNVIVNEDGFVQDTSPPEPIQRKEKYTGDMEYDLETHGLQPGETEDQYFQRMQKKILDKKEEIIKG